MQGRLRYSVLLQFFKKDLKDCENKLQNIKNSLNDFQVEEWNSGKQRTLKLTVGYLVIPWKHILKIDGL